MAVLVIPLQKLYHVEVVADEACKKIFVTYYVNPGEVAYFGNVCIEGLCKVKRAFVAKRIFWKKGEIFKPRKVALTDTYLKEAGLFSNVVVLPGSAIGPDGLLPMTIYVEEMKYRHVGLGVSYSTDEFFGGMAQWSHDNITGMGDSFSITGEYSEVVKRGTAIYTRPDVICLNQDFSISTEFRNEDAPGFIENEGSVLLRLRHRVNENFSYNYGGRYEYLESTKSFPREHYHLLSAPIQIRYDTSNRLLNKTRGTTISLLLTPYQSLFEPSFFFFKQELLGAYYQIMWRHPEIMLTLTAQVGSIVGQQRFTIPAPKRFYAGSATGLRGYKYLTVSPLDGTKPIGGRSLMIVQIEPRVHVWKNLYAAAFLDAGNVYTKPYPDFDKKLLRSYGVGLRYMTALGLFRLDAGFPLDRRKDIDSFFQIYASVGQAF